MAKTVFVINYHDLKGVPQTITYETYHVAMRALEFLKSKGVTDAKMKIDFVNKASKQMPINIEESNDD